MDIGDIVRKKSGKPFQNGLKTAIVCSLTTMEIPVKHTQVGTKIVSAVILGACKGKVEEDILEVVKSFPTCPQCLQQAAKYVNTLSMPYPLGTTHHLWCDKCRWLAWLRIEESQLKEIIIMENEHA